MISIFEIRAPCAEPAPKFPETPFPTHPWEGGKQHVIFGGRGRCKKRGIREEAGKKGQWRRESGRGCMVGGGGAGRLRLLGEVSARELPTPEVLEAVQGEAGTAEEGRGSVRITPC